MAALRTPFGRYGGALASVRPDDLAAAVIRALVDRTGIDPAAIEDVILGCANQAGEDNRNVARMALLLAGLPVEVAGLTVNRLCGSGLQAVNSAAHAIAVGDGDVFIAGGVESMTRAPYVMLKPEAAFERGAHELVDTTLGWRFVNPALAAAHHPYSMGETGENVAERLGVSREDAGRLRPGEPAQRGRGDRRGPLCASRSCRSRSRRRRATRSSWIATSIPRETSMEALAKLRPAFREGGTVTAGNSSGINDGAAAALVVEAGRARALGLRADGPHRGHGRRRRGSRGHGPRPDPGHSQGPGAGRHRRSPTWIWSSSTRPSPASPSPASASWASTRRR